MDELILVERTDGPTVIGLLTAMVAHWDQIPLAVQASMIEQASRAAFDKVGRPDGRTMVTAFVLKHRAALARRRREAETLGSRWRDTIDKIDEKRRQMVDYANRWPVPKWLAALRRAA